MKKITFNTLAAIGLLMLITSGKTATACSASFTHTNACAGDTVWFYAQDQYAVYTWDFGDNNSQININHDTSTFHVYTTPGTYYVQLFVNVGAEWDYQTQIITIGTTCFNADFTTTCGGSNYMYFYSQSPGAITQTWDFGDPGSGANNTSTLANPYHLYAAPGTFTVILIANNGTTADTITQSVVVPASCIGANFNAGMSANCYNDSTVFYVSYTGTITSYNWNFGDPASGAANTSVLSNPKHLFSAVGFYIVTLTISNGIDTQNIFYCLQVEDCSCWPGDTNGDGEVNEEDVFSLGIFYGDHGPQRTAATNNFTSQPGTDWPGFNNLMYLQSMKNKKIADCNGDSTINGADLAVVLANYGMSHTTHNNVSGMPEATSADPSMYIQLPAGANSGAVITAPIYLGTAAHPCINLYGYSFSVNYNPGLVVAGSVYIDLTTNWLGNAGNELMITHDNAVNGKIDAAVVRYDKTQIPSGYGQIGTITFQLQPGATGSLHLEFSPSAKALSTTMWSSTISSNMEVFRPVNLVAGDLNVSVGIASLTDDNTIQIFPNPANDLINIALNTSEVSEIKLMNTLGQVIYTANGCFFNTVKINTSSYNKGMYTLSCRTKDGIVFKKMNVVH